MEERVLIVYPDEELRLGCEAVLNLRGINAECAASAEEALRLMKRNSYVAVISGVRLEHTSETRVFYLDKPFTAARLLAVLNIRGDSF